MTVRGANYPRRANDDYPTPPDPIDALFRLIRFSKMVYDPCCGRGRAVMKVAKSHGHEAHGTDIVNGHDFLICDPLSFNDCDIVTNPPYGGRRGTLAMRFIERALEVTKRRRHKVAMLLPIDFDSARTRSHVFQHPAFSVKIVLLDRIKWFDGQSGSTNHAWYCWDWRNEGDPIIKYTRIEESSSRRR